MSNNNAMLRAILDCGSLDVEFIDRELDNFKVGAGAVVESIRETGDDHIDANTFLHHIYRIALNDAISETEADGSRLNGDNTVSIVTNCIDSHLFIKDNGGEWREMHNYEELVAFLKANYVYE